MPSRPVHGLGDNHRAETPDQNSLGYKVTGPEITQFSQIIVPFQLPTRLQGESGRKDPLMIIIRYG